MRNIWIICRKEIRSYFVSPIAYLLLAMYAFVFGWMFSGTVKQFVDIGMEMQMRGEMYPMNINEQVVRGLLYNGGVLALFLIPMISMRLFAEEKRTGTIELLVTSPITDLEVILGKWLAAMGIYAAMLLVAGLNFLVLFKYGNPDLKPFLIGYLGLLLQGGALLALGTFLSTLTNNQIVAAGATFGLCLVLWIIGWDSVSGYDSSALSRALSYLSLPTHYESFAKGTLSSKDTIFYFTLIFAGLFFSARSMESLRWRA